MTLLSERELVLDLQPLEFLTAGFEIRSDLCPTLERLDEEVEEQETGEAGDNMSGERVGESGRCSNVKLGP